jgi:hypothetical protein
MDQTLDRLQFDLQLLRNRVTILEALVLPKTETPNLGVSPAEDSSARPTSGGFPPTLDAQTTSLSTPELNIATGMTTGQRG